MKILQLTRGKYTFVDNEDYELLWKLGRWFCSDHGYASKDARKSDPWPTRSVLYVHRVVMEWAGLLESGLEVDHIDGNGLNNQKHNLRMVTKAENQMNRACAIGLSRYKGVYLSKATGKWVAQIKLAGKQKYLGYFKTQEDAARAYDNAAKNTFGEYARLNTPE